MGSHGFYYRQSIGGSAQNPISEPQQAATTEADPFAIPTASVDQLIDSSKEKLVSDLNEQARRSNPAIFIYIFVGILLVAALMLMSDSSASLPNDILPNGTNSSGDTSVDEYAVLLARYGQPNMIEVDQQPNLTSYIADYSSQDLGIVFVPRGCTDVYQALLQQASQPPLSDTLPKRNSRPAHQRQKPVSLPHCTPSFVGFTIVSYKDLTSGKNLPAEDAINRLSQLQSHLQTAPEIKVIVPAPQPQSKNHLKPQTVPVKAPIIAPTYDKQTFSDEQRRIAAQEASNARQRKISLATLGSAVVFLVLAGITHRRFNKSREIEISYSLNGKIADEYKRLREGLAQLGASHRLWRLISEQYTDDRRRNAGATSLIKRTAARVVIAMPPHVHSNLQHDCLWLDNAQFYFLPDFILCWQQGSYASIAYSDLNVSTSKTRFVEDEQVPSDAVSAGYTWKYVRKDGGPDRRFSDNRQLPILLYTQIFLKTSSGLNLVMMASRQQSGDSFTQAVAEIGGKRPPISSTGSSDNGSANVDSANTIKQTLALKVFGLSIGASQAEIHAAYISLVQKYHPDKVAGLGPEILETAERKMKEINGAYATLKS